MSLAHKIVPIGQEHIDILMAAALAGVDVEPCVNGIRTIYYGDTQYGYGPVAIVDTAGTEYVAEPHVTWFPWVSKRDKILNFQAYLKTVGNGTQQLMIITEKKENLFYEHFVKRGVLRKVGHLINVPLVDEVHFYQYGGNKA